MDSCDYPSGYCMTCGFDRTDCICDRDEAPATVVIHCRRCHREVEVSEDEVSLYWGGGDTICPACVDREWEKCHDA